MYYRIILKITLAQIFWDTVHITFYCVFLQINAYSYLDLQM